VLGGPLSRAAQTGPDYDEHDPSGNKQTEIKPGKRQAARSVRGQRPARWTYLLLHVSAGTAVPLAC